jgi:hypothetical protein
MVSTLVEDGRRQLQVRVRWPRTSLVTLAPHGEVHSQRFLFAEVCPCAALSSPLSRY